ncbi:GDP-mannose 4,6-dehydratase [Patescibacteria group bacterium]|nr:GDP-mannose 4,6-dehydratase [Patescibacteria group bacterium]MBU4057745.1 GDP-mannose 4,6-dehydratase [Patescibacteria group bacterium]MBU4115795.1 GDP-mannose 4,6-dehydratase [Patescibacteria group bacterium]
MNTILITGGAGFIGSNLIEKILSDNKYRVVCVDNFDNNYDPSFKKDNISLFLKNKSFILYRSDISKRDNLLKIFKKEKPDYIIHLAAKTDTRKAIDAPYDYVSTNVVGTLNLLDLAKDFKIKKFIFASSSSVYGNKNKAPFSEENNISYPLSPYGATKKMGEMLAYNYYYNFGLNVVCLRIFNAYGERNRPDLVLYKWTKNILQRKSIEMSGRGEKIRDFTYVGDIVRGILLSLKSNIKYDIINLGNSKPISLQKLLNIVEKEIGIKAKIRNRPSNKSSVEMTCADISKARKILKWKPETELKDGINKLVVWIRNNRSEKSH